MTFTTAAIATSVAGFILGFGWLLAGCLVMRRWGVVAEADGLLVGRRLGAVYISIATLLLLGRSAPPSDLRTIVSVALLLALSLLAALGVLEYVTKRAKAGILVSVAIEAVLASLFAWVLLAERVA